MKKLFIFFCLFATTAFAGPLGWWANFGPVCSHGSQVITTTGIGSFTLPANCVSLTIEGIGGGGSGGAGGCKSSNAGGGGGGGACFQDVLTGLTPGTIYAFSVGAGGAVSSGTSCTGHAGVATTVTLPVLSAGGGALGHGDTAGSDGAGGLGGTATGGSSNVSGSAGANGSVPSASNGGKGGNAASCGSLTGGAGGATDTGSGAGNSHNGVSPGGASSGSNGNSSGDNATTGANGEIKFIW